jgi:prevent-host-death family protein
MTIVSIKEAKNRLPEVVRLAEAGERVTITRNGKPVADLVPHQRKGGIDLEALAEFKRTHGIERFFGDVSADFDDPLPEDFLLKPLP